MGVTTALSWEKNYKSSPLGGGRTLSEVFKMHSLVPLLVKKKAYFHSDFERKIGLFAFCIGCQRKSGSGQLLRFYRNMEFKPNCTHSGQQLRFSIYPGVQGKGWGVLRCKPSQAQAGPLTPSPYHTAERVENKWQSWGMMSLHTHGQRSANERGLIPRLMENNYPFPWGEQPLSRPGLPFVYSQISCGEIPHSDQENAVRKEPQVKSPKIQGQHGFLLL